MRVSQSIRALALICFVCSEEDENTEELLVLFEKYHDLKIAGSICSVALEAWGLLASSMSDEELAGDEYVDRCVCNALSSVDVNAHLHVSRMVAICVRAGVCRASWSS